MHIPASVRRRAKAEGKAIIVLAIDGRTCSPETDSVDYYSPATAEEAEEVYALLDKLLRLKGNANG